MADHKQHTRYYAMRMTRMTPHGNSDVASWAAKIIVELGNGSEVLHAPRSNGDAVKIGWLAEDEPAQSSDSTAPW